MRMSKITCLLDQAVSPDQFDSGRDVIQMNVYTETMSHVTLTRLFCLRACLTRVWVCANDR